MPITMSKSSPFTHLHTHSHYSLLEALAKIPDLVKKAKKCGMESLALTDSGNLYGAIEFYKECKENGIKPIIGVDFYVALRTRHDKEARIDNQRSRLVLLAENETGYKNLLKLVSASYLEGFYYKPRIDRELLERYNEGLIAIAKEDLPAFETVKSIQEFINRGSFGEEEDLHFRTRDETKKDYKTNPEKLSKTVEIAERCNLILELGKWVFPNYVTKPGKSYDEELRDLVYEGLKKKSI